MKMRKLVLTVMVAVGMMALVGCGSNSASFEDNAKYSCAEGPSGFVAINLERTNERTAGRSVVTYVDTETGVMYVALKGYSDGGLALQVLYNADGTLRIYDGDLEALQAAAYAE